MNAVAVGSTALQKSCPTHFAELSSYSCWHLAPPAGGSVFGCGRADPCVFFPGKTSQETCFPDTALPWCDSSFAEPGGAGAEYSGGTGSSAELAMDGDQFTAWDSSPWNSGSTLSVLAIDLGFGSNSTYQECYDLGFGATSCYDRVPGVQPVTKYRLQFAGERCHARMCTHVTRTHAS